MPVVFLDFEASSLLPGSFPIEIAWVHENGDGESYLIRPAPGWLDEARGNPGWSRESQAVHRIGLATLLAEGAPHQEVAVRAAGILGVADITVCSDSPGFDGFWLRALLDAADVRIEVKVVDVAEAYARACSPLLRMLPLTDDRARERAEQRVRNMATEIIAEAEHWESLRPRVKHRALADAKSLWRTWRTVGEEAARTAQAGGYPEIRPAMQGSGALRPSRSL